MSGCSGLHLSSPFLKGTLLLCCQGSVNVRVRILICEPCWDSGAVAADFTACNCCRPQPVLSIQNGICGDWGLGCGTVTAVTEKLQCYKCCNLWWEHHLRTVVLKSKILNPWRPGAGVLGKAGYILQIPLWSFSCAISNFSVQWAEPSFALQHCANVEVRSAFAHAVSQDVLQLWCTNPWQTFPHSPEDCSWSSGRIFRSYPVLEMVSCYSGLCQPSESR